jgi:hypothetical protein
MNKDNDIPLILYKYINLEDGLKILLNQTLKLSSPSVFNDPFDFSNSLIDYKISKEYAKDLVERRFNSDSRKEKRAKARELQKSHKMQPVFDDGITKHKERFRVSCFSKIKDEILMWSHYADKHKGICIGLKIPLVSNDFFTLPVNYTIEINPLDFNADRTKSIKYWMTTKYKKWIYEEEYRIINDQSTEIINIDTGWVQEIIFGCSIDNELMLETIDSLVKKGYDKNIMRKMEMEKLKFSLKEEKIK